MQAGNFIIEYCGEVISWKEAKRRSQAYEIQGGIYIIKKLLTLLWYEVHYFMWLVSGLKDAFIISLNTSESIDATEKGSLARFINHSWWAILGRVSIEEEISN